MACPSAGLICTTVSACGTGQPDEALTVMLLRRMGHPAARQEEELPLRDGTMVKDMT